MKMKMKMNKLTLIAATVFALALSPTAFADGRPFQELQDQIDELKGQVGSVDQSTIDGINDRIEQVDKEDMRVKNGNVAGDTLTLRVEDYAKTQGRSEIYGQDVDIDVSSLNQADEVADLNTRLEQGLAGAKGDKGDTGATGAKGDKGDKGDTGATGAKGDKGERGLRGFAGADGKDGVDGQDGRDGVVDQQTLQTINNNTTNIEGNSEEINNIDNRVTVNEGDIEGNTTEINKQGDRITVNEGDIEGLGDRVTVNEGDIENHDTRISANEQAINEFNEFNNTGFGSYRNDIDANAYGINQNRAAINDLRNDINYLDRNLSAGIASAVAMGQHNFDPTYQSGQVSIAGGHFNGANAVSIAVGVPINSNTFFSASAAANDGPGNESIGFGVTYRLP